jgi:A/G-specific adenine glycosylase
MINIQELKKETKSFYKNNRRELPWRNTHDPYHILVSEMMLQQTQVNRVKEKYVEFIAKFPTIGALANASLADVLKTWQGLGYNRRAKYLKITAEKIVQKHNGQVPKTIVELTALPGIGHNTAGAILAYAFNTSAPYIETNIRTVFIHHCFENNTSVSDAEISPLLAQSLINESAREWYSALMDYGTHLKETIGNISQKSKHYTRQSKFEGSNRQLRGKIITTLTKKPHTEKEIAKKLKANQEKTKQILKQLQTEHLIKKIGNKFKL